ncbi:MAG: ATP synthase F1 subunit gamma [Eubacterium sp.]|nr:ATP synthase F1 subunit gamma [Eubacterium sp.]MBR0398240.1 ATP synthase F1 subunit gamma [Eubacterium sp.]
MASNMKAVKTRIKSVQNTMQITRAMELVASSKLRKAKERAETCKPYFQELHRALQEIANGNTDFTSVFAKETGVEQTCYIVIGGDRGLAGGYNNNLFKLMEEDRGDKNCVVVPIGKKPIEYYRRKKINPLTERFELVADVSVSDCFTIAKLLCAAYREGVYGHLKLVYTRFQSMLSQIPDVVNVLPLPDLMDPELAEKHEPVRKLIEYDPDPMTVFDAIVPEYLAGLIYSAVCESLASELAARRNAMDNATKNAEEMIETLNLQYNRARQSSITQEITEIIAGAEEL